jgi:hypothetical protein
LIWHLHSRRIAPWRIAKNKRVIKLDFFNQISRLFIILFGFTWESNDDVGGNCNALACVSNAVNKIDIFLRRVGSMHHFENSVGAGLQR